MNNAAKIGSDNPPANLPEDHERLFFRALMDQLPFSIYFKDRDSRFILVSRWKAKKAGLEPEEMIGWNDAMQFGPIHAAVARADELEVMETGQPIINKEEREDLPDGSIAWARTTKIALRDANGEVIGTFGASNDITKRILAEQALQRERKLLRTLIDMLPFRVFVKDCEGRYLLSNAVHCATIGVKDDSELIGKTILDFRSDDGGRRSDKRDRLVIESGEPLFDREQPDLLNPGQGRWVISSRMPIIGEDNKVEGLVGVSIDHTSRKHAEIDLLEREQRMREELEVARKLQEALLPDSEPANTARRVRSMDKYEISFLYRPCEQLAGDFIHLIKIGDRKVGILIADVMGHGVRAALVTSMIAGFVRRLEPLAEQPEKFINELNRGVSSMVKNTRSFLFATACYAVIEDQAEKSILSYCNAGHCGPICFHGAIKQVLPQLAGPALVLNPDFQYSSVNQEVPKGCRFFFITDGFYEATSPEGKEWGLNSLESVLSKTSDIPLVDQIEATFERLKQFSSREHFDDDLCLIGLQRQER